MNAKILGRLGLLVLLCAGPWVRAADPPALEDFFTGLRIRQVAISPDARYLSMIAVRDGHFTILILDRSAGNTLRPLLSARQEEKFTPSWCGWANPTRLLCGFRALESEGGKFFPFTRLMAINADGSQLIQITNRRSITGGQFEDRVLDWTPDDPRTVLMEIDEGDEATAHGGSANVVGGGPTGYPNVYSVDVYTGKRKMAQREHAPIEHFMTDGQGAVRLGYGYHVNTNKNEIVYFARLVGEDRWRELKRLNALDHDDDFEPLAVIANTNFAYARKDYQKRSAIWKIDLSDATDPVVAFSHPQVDVDEPIYTQDHQLIGVAYEAERPGIFYSDPQAAAAYDAVRAALPGRTVSVVDMTPDKKTFVVRAGRDSEADAYYVLDIRGGGTRFDAVGSEAPGLLNKALAPMLSIRFAARDGASIPGYLTLPVRGPAQGKPPLIVMPHGGPQSRDSWGYDTLVQFLASRGYAVLQLEFRGSSGYGSDWFRAGFRDWGGLPYDDVIDGTRWALEQGYADPARTCIVGASYGGYLSLLAATRSAGSPFGCAVSIAGVSDLLELKRDNRFFRHWEIANAALESGTRKLREDSPRLHADRAGIPVLLIHGDHDYTVEVDHTKMMDAALNRAGKAHETIYIEGADHYFREDAALRKLLTSLGEFLERRFGKSAAP